MTGNNSPDQEWHPSDLLIQEDVSRPYAGSIYTHRENHGTATYVPSRLGSLMSPFQPTVVLGFSKYTRITISRSSAYLPICAFSHSADVFGDVQNGERKWVLLGACMETGYPISRDSRMLQTLSRLRMSWAETRSFEHDADRFSDRRADHSRFIQYVQSFAPEPYSHDELIGD